jgi:spermidine synthase
MAAQHSPETLTPFSVLRVLPATVGFSAITGQIVLMRELISLSSGNELSLGWMLGAWLVWSALGSLLGDTVFRRVPLQREQVASIAIVGGLSLPATIWLLRWMRTLLTSAPTELLSPMKTLVLCVTCLCVFCVLSGCLFAMAVHTYSQGAHVWPGRALVRVYLLESAGTAIAGIFAGAVLLQFLSPIQIAFVICALNGCLAVSLLNRIPTRRRMAIVGILSTLTFPVIVGLAPAVERVSQERQWAPLLLISTRDTLYGRISVTDAGGIHSIYQDGDLLANLPDKAAAEEAVHYALLEHAAPRRILLLGGSAAGGVEEALQYPTIELVDAVELDPGIRTALRSVRSNERETLVSDSRVHIHFGDGRQYIHTASTRYDVIIVNVGEPISAQWNRFYTIEFFQLARKRLAPGGIMALQLHSSEEFISAERAEFLRCIRATLNLAFPYIVVIPGDPIHMLGAVDANTLSEDPAVLVERLHARHLNTQYVNEHFFPFRMSAERRQFTDEALQSTETTPVNHDFHPVAYYFGQMLWSSQFDARYGAVLHHLTRISPASAFGWVSAMLILFGFVVSKFGLPELRWRTASRWSICATGYCLMSLQILLLVTFQCIYGYLYYGISMLIAMFMAGIAFGSFMGLRHPANPRIVPLAVMNQLIIATLGPLFMLIATLLATGPEASSCRPIAMIAFTSIAFLCGIPGGLQFSISSELFMGPLPDQDSKLASSAKRMKRWGVSLYALDLLGGSVGALVISGFLIPVYGLWCTAWLASLMCVAPGVWLALIATDSFALSERIEVSQIPPR